MDNTTLGDPDLPVILADAARLAALAATGLPDGPVEMSFDRLARLAGKLLGVPVALVSLVDSQRQFFKACVGLPEPWASKRETPLSHSFCKHVVASGEPLVISDARNDPRLAGNLAIPDLGVIAYLGIPITIEGQVIGSFCAIDAKPRAWTPDDVATMTDLAQSVISEIRLRAESADLIRSRQDAEEAKKNIEVTLASIADAVIATDAKGVVTYINPVACQLAGWPAEEATGQPAATVFDIIEEATGRKIEQFIDHVLASGRPIAWRDHTILLARDGTRREIEESAAPILIDGQIIGAVVTFRDNSKRRLRLQEIEARERQFRTLAESLPQMAWMADAKGNRFWFNKRWYDYTGTQFDQVKSWGWEAVHDPTKLPAVRERFAESFRTGEDFEMVYPLKGADGTFRPFLTRMVAIHDEDGSINRWLGINTDITATQKAEEELRDARQRLENALSAGSVATFTWDIPNDRIGGDVNLAKFYGISPERISEAPLAEYFDAIHPEDRDQVMRTITEAIADRETYHAAYRIRQADGTPMRVIARATIARDEAGRPLSMSGIVMDVTEREQANETIRQGEEQYRTLYNSIDAAYCVLHMLYDEQGRPVDYRFLAVNPAFEKQTGWSNAIGKRLREFTDQVDPRLMEAFEAVIRTGEPMRAEDNVNELEGRTFDVFCFRVGESGDRTFGVLFNDITHRKRNEAEREELVAQLTDADRRKDEFLAMLAHELRNPLGAISSGVELVQRVQKPEVLAELRGMIQHQVKHLTHLIDDLLDVSRITQGKVQLRNATVELTAITRKAAELAQPQIDEKRHELSVATPAKPVLFVADPTRVEQMLSNLLTNAAKYSEPGREIHLSAKADGPEVVFRIRDQGYGITAEMLPKIFGLFTQIDATIDRSRGGLGIGLTLVRNLAELHGGSVSATSEGKDQGSVFTLRLPIGQPEAVTTPAFTPPPRAAARPSRDQHRILIVDDNRDTARMTSRLLEHQGYAMMMAHDGFEGVEAAKAFRPHVILLDIGLPGMSGYDVAAAIRDHECCRDSVIVAVSGYGETAARERSKEVGIDHHLTKPLDFNRLDVILGTLAHVGSEG